MERISNFSEELVKFIIMHELCHSLNNPEDNNPIIGDIIQNINNRGINTIIPIKELQNNSNDKQLIEYIKSIGVFKSYN